MYRVVLVDDESVSLRLLRNFVTTYFSVFEIAGAFESGVDALNYLRLNPVDLLITDIKMPIMSGIELAKCARRLNERVHIIITSGYAEFDFAKGAMEAGVDEYLLKPLNLDQFKKALSTIIEKLNAEYEKRRLELLHDLLNGQNINTDEITRYFNSKNCCTALVHLANLHANHYERGDGQIPITFSDERIYRLDGRDKSECILVGIQPFVNGSIQLVPEANNYVTVILDSTLQPFTRLHARVLELYELMDTCVVIGKTQVLDKTHIHSHEFQRLNQNELRMIDHAITSGNYPLLRQTFRAYGERWDSQAVPQLWIEKAVYQILEHALLQIPQSRIRETHIYEKLNAIYTLAGNYTDLMERFFELLYDTLPHSDRAKRVPEELYRQILKYMRENYSAPLTTQSVSTLMDISPAYLSKLFRTYENRTFNELLTDFRIENACRLLGNADLRLNDIAKMVGYDSQSYFCKVFRQYTGKTPGQYAQSKTTSTIEKEVPEK